MEAKANEGEATRARRRATRVGLAVARLGLIVVFPDAISIHNICKESLRSVS
jgi:hypothetical protein